LTGQQDVDGCEAERRDRADLPAYRVDVGDVARDRFPDVVGLVERLELGEDGTKVPPKTSG
jgi:hypothetical protein